MRLSALALSGLLVTGCSGAQLSLPAISDAEVASAKLAMDARPVNLTEYYRTDEEAASLVSKIGNTLKLAAGRTCQRLEFSPCVFHVNYIPDDTVNALADDTTVYVLRGLIRYLATEDEIAAVIGHEIGHVIAEHYEETQQNQILGALIGGLLIGGLMAGTGYYSSPGYDPQTSQDILEGGMRLGAGVGRLSFSKEQEREADLISAYLLADAGYDLGAAGRVFEVMTALGGDKVKAGLLDTHPAGPERVASWTRAMAEVQPQVPQPAVTPSVALPAQDHERVGQLPEEQQFNAVASDTCKWNPTKYRYECWDFDEGNTTPSDSISAVPTADLPMAAPSASGISADPRCVWNPRKYHYECW